MSKRSRSDSTKATESTAPQDLDEGELDTVQGGVSLLLPAVQAAREAARKKADGNDLFIPLKKKI